MDDEFVISSGKKRIAIKDETGEVRGVISFNPKDAAFTERFYQLIGEFKVKMEELQDISTELDKDSRLDENGLFVNTSERLSFVRETCVFLRGRIDHLFGEGTSQIAFGDSLNLEVFPEFFEGITPFVQKAREAAMSKYVDNKPSRVMK